MIQWHIFNIATNWNLQSNLSEYLKEMFFPCVFVYEGGSVEHVVHLNDVYFKFT